MRRAFRQLSSKLPSTHAFIAKTNGQAWFEHHQKLRSLITPEVVRGLSVKGGTDITGAANYAKPASGDEETRYDVALGFQTNYLYAKCDLVGAVVACDEANATDHSMMAGFYGDRAECKALDVGANTGKNMMTAKKVSKGKVDIYGLEYSSDSVELGLKALGDGGADRLFPGDCTGDYVSKHGWESSFDLAHCTFVLQHLPPNSFDAAMKSIARSLKEGGELLTTIKDAPTKEQLIKYGMEDWCDEIYTAELAPEADYVKYVKEGVLHGFIWDDDYYPGGDSPPTSRDLDKPGPHRRELYFYNFDWVKNCAQKYGLELKEAGIVNDAKRPYSNLSWKCVFVKI